MSATLLVEDTFELTWRDLVILGQILEGTIYIGSRIILSDASGMEQRERITDMEDVRRTRDGRPVSSVGLILREFPKNNIPEMRSRLQQGDILTIEDPESE